MVFISYFSKAEESKINNKTLIDIIRNGTIVERITMDLRMPRMLMRHRCRDLSRRQSVLEEP